MSASDHLGNYAKGWINGDVNLILQSLATDYILDDPNSGKISKEMFSEYLENMKETVKAINGGNLPEPFMELTEVVTSEESEMLTAWCSWSIPNTSIKGAGLIKVAAAGVYFEQLTYYTKLGA